MWALPVPAWSAAVAYCLSGATMSDCGFGRSPVSLIPSSCLNELLYLIHSGQRSSRDRTILSRERSFSRSIANIVRTVSNMLRLNAYKSAESRLILLSTTFDWASERSKTDLLPGIVFPVPLVSVLLNEESSKRRSPGLWSSFPATLSRK